ncbi:hypothetical protein [Hymenobacter persicinus]|uniref:Uncharacterized protein n=1 Tax=Hymenobacter persicinus TaxID=2025506 RepID=A0A4Q5LFH8_9BACT|nr:hypothetical protein [Hymenobacter persicinus]RYU81602.1 hypothetical protein EWM57_06295 [Hymenobacter persicinus]
MADNKKPTPADDTSEAVGATRATPVDPQTTSPTIDTEAGVTMGDGIHHLHSLSKGDEDYINGETPEDDSRSKPGQDKR